MIKNKINFIKFFVIIIFFMLKTQNVFAIIGDSTGLSPFLNWKTLETKHFRITFPEELKIIALKSAQYFEEAHQELVPFLRWNTTAKTQVLIIDNMDTANGFAAPTLRIGIVLYATPPESWSSLSTYDDWLRILIFHEYTHYLNIDPVRSFYSFFHFLFGDIIKPNALLPRWMLEGLAVYVETEWTHAGRGRSSYWNGILRSAVNENVLGTSKMPTIDQLNGEIPQFPGGEIPYLFGYYLNKSLSRHPTINELDFTADSESAISDSTDVYGILSQRSSGRVPFFINGNLENVTGLNWYKIWDWWVAQSKVKYQKEIKILKKSKLTEYTSLTPSDFFSFGARISSDGKWLAYTHLNPDEQMGLFLKDLKTGEVIRLANKILGSSISFTPDSKHIVFSTLERDGFYKNWSDLAIISIKNKKITPLTQNFRAKDPNLSPDGKKLTFTVSHAGKIDLYLADFVYDHKDERHKIENSRPIYTVKPFQKISNPVFSPKQDKIIFSFHNNEQPKEALIAIQIKDLKSKFLISDASFNRFPTFDSRGNLYFISNKTGVDNLYLYRPSQSPLMMTNMIGGIWFPTFSSSGDLYASVLNYHGWSIAQIKHLTQFQNFNESKLKVSSYENFEPKKIPYSFENKEITYLKSENNIHNYSPWPSLLPRQWSPFLVIDPKSVYTGLTISGFDALDFHRYTLGLNYDSLTKKPDSFLSYSNRNLGITLTGAASYRTSLRNVSTSGDLNTYSRKLNFAAMISYPFQWTRSQLVPYITFETERESYFSAQNRTQPFASSKYVPELTGAFLFSNTASSKNGLIPEEGRKIEAGAKIYQVGSENVWKGLWKQTEYTNLFHHVVAESKLLATHSSRLSSYFDANVITKGRDLTFPSDFPTSTFDHIQIRGYAHHIYVARQLALLSTDIHIPLIRVFHGLGTNPFFFKNLSQVFFGEASYFPYREPGTLFLPSAGTALRLSSTLFQYIPVTFSLELHHGFKPKNGAKNDIFAQILLGSLNL